MGAAAATVTAGAGVAEPPVRLSGTSVAQVCGTSLALDAPAVAESSSVPPPPHAVTSSASPTPAQATALRRSSFPIRIDPRFKTV